MAEENKAIEWPGGANVADDFDFLMVGKDGEPIMKIPKEKLNEVIVINGEGIKAVAGGASSATPTILAPGPAGQNRKMEDVTGWFVNGTGTPLVAVGEPWEAPAGFKNTNWWDGTTWSLGSSVALPIQQGVDIIDPSGNAIPKEKAVANYVLPISSKLTEITVGGNQLFDNSTMLGGRYNNDTGVYTANLNWISTPILNIEDLKTKVSATGLGSIPTSAKRFLFWNGNTFLGSFGDTSTQTVDIPATATKFAINVANVINIGSNPTNSSYANTAMVNYGDPLPFEAFTTFVPANKIKGQIPQVASIDTKVTKVDQKVSSFTVGSNQLFDNSTMLGGTWNGDTGVFVANSNWISTPKMERDPSKPRVSITGGGSYGNTIKKFYFWNGDTFLGSFGNYNTDSADFPTGTTHYAARIANAVNIGVSPTLSPYAETLMVNYGDPLPFEKYDTNQLYVDAKYLRGLTINQNPIAFYSYDPVGFSGRPSFYFYVKYEESDSVYIRFRVVNFYDEDPLVYSNQYRIYDAYQVKLINGSFVLTGQEILRGGESECVYKRNNTADFTGGVHGDEQLLKVDFYIDGVNISPGNTPIPLTPCSNIEYRQLSTMHETATGNSTDYVINMDHPVEANHVKITKFCDSGYETYNSLKWRASNLPILHWYHGICCVAKSNGLYVENEFLERAGMIGDDIEKLQHVGARDYFSSNAETGMGAQITSRLISPKQFIDGSNIVIPDMTCLMKIWDRQDNKYYRQFYPLKPITNGDMWESIMKVKFFVKN